MAAKPGERRMPRNATSKSFDRPRARAGDVRSFLVGDVGGRQARERIADEKPWPMALLVGELDHFVTEPLAKRSRIKAQEQLVERSRHGSTSLALADSRTRSSFRASAASALRPARVIL